MISYKGRRSLKQYLPRKPHKLGFKMFTRAGVSDIVYDFCLYIREGSCQSLELGISSDIVLQSCWKKYILNIPSPGIVECYNKHMAGVDLADKLLELYKINHRSKK